MMKQWKNFVPLLRTPLYDRLVLHARRITRVPLIRTVDDGQFFRPRKKTTDKALRELQVIIKSNIALIGTHTHARAQINHYSLIIISMRSLHNTLLTSTRKYA